MIDASQILQAAARGDAQAASQLLPLLYDELRRMAAQKLALEKAGQTLDPTALVHEAYLRLVGTAPEKAWQGRSHFFGAAAEAMRRILIENARRKRRLRHGGDRQRTPMDVAEVAEAAADDAADDRLLAIDEALDRLAAEEPQVAEVVKLRYFVGMTIAQTAEALAISVRTANRHWAYARAWLFEQLG
jgi:RNA polymerase sigma factor (TIGR02999 family)